MEFIYFNLLAILVNFLDQLVIVICKPVLEDLTLSRIRSMFIIDLNST